jgi:tetratricopeptide (TPR) repeat protein
VRRRIAARRRPAALGAALLLVLTSSHAAEPASPKVEPDVQALQESMREGLEALHAGRPADAVDVFREVLTRMPSHYGARYQLAVALDAVGDHAWAELLWQEVQTNARAVGDLATAETASRRATSARRAASMKEGLRLLQDAGDPDAAAEVFRQVLADLPTHYGAAFHLACALERSDRPDAAIEPWRRVLEMARGYHDARTQARARQAIVALETDAIMKRGLEELYDRRRPWEAAQRFRSVLAIWPSHYGATYQLAVALDEAGRPDEALSHWKQALEMAQSYRDEPVVAAARARLAR